MTIGENIKKYRTAAGITQAHLAEAVKTTQPAISDYEAGNVTPNIKMADKLAQALGVTLMDLLRDTISIQEELDRR